MRRKICIIVCVCVFCCNFHFPKPVTQAQTFVMARVDTQLYVYACVPAIKGVAKQVAVWACMRTTSCKHFFSCFYKCGIVFSDCILSMLATQIYTVQDSNMTKMDNFSGQIYFLQVNTLQPNTMTLTCCYFCIFTTKTQ